MDGRDQILAKLLEIRENVKARKDFSYMYTENGVILGAGRPAAVGKEQIFNDLEFYYNEGCRDFIYEEPIIEVHGDIATCWLLMKLADKDGKVYFHGKNTIVWKRDPESKEWLIYIDMFNEGR